MVAGLKWVIEHTKSLIEQVLPHPVLTLNNKPELAPIFIEAGTSHIGNKQSSYVALPSPQKRHKPTVMSYLFCALDELHVHLQTARTKVRRSSPSPIRSLLTPGTGCSSPSMMIMDNRQTNGITRKGNEGPQIIAGPLLCIILTNK